jgi:hypothetical protein
MLHSDVTYFWDWFVFGMAIWLLVGFIAAWFSKPVRAQIVRVPDALAYLLRPARLTQ